MADNTTLNTGTGGDVIRTDDIAGVKYPVSKIAIGIDGVNDGLVSATTPLPVNDAGGSLTVDGTVAISGTVPVSGTITANAGTGPFPVSDNAGSLTVDGTVTANAGTGPWPVTDNGGSLTVDGTVGVSGTVPVSNAGTFAVQESQLVADDAAFGVGSSMVRPAGFLADETASDSVDEGDIGAARMTLDRFQKVVAQLESSSMRIGGTAVTPQFAAIACSASGNNSIVAADATKKIRVLKWSVIADADNSIKWRSASTDLTGAMSLPADGAGVSGSFCPVGHFETVANEALNLNLSAATAVAGYLVYIKV